MAIKTVEDLVTEANKRGWTVLNLFQINQDSWRCNLQKRNPNGGTTDVYTEFADGRTMHEAVAAAVRNTEAPRNRRAGSEAEEAVEANEVNPFMVLALAEALTAGTAARTADTARRKA